MDLTTPDRETPCPCPATRPRVFARLPRLADVVPWLSLGGRVTPVERLAAEGVEGAWVKRDDLSAPTYGGNKVRKLEFLLAEARRRGVERVITAGATGSHHALATTVYATEMGLGVTLVLFPQPVTPKVMDALRIEHALGAELRFTPRMELVPLALAAARLAQGRARVMMIPPGGSDPLGALGYVDAALELADQIAAGECPAPEIVHVAAGTLGTAAGLALGFALAGLPTRVQATRISSKLVTNERTLRRLIEGGAALLARGGAELPPAAEIMARVELNHEQLGPGYALETSASSEARRRFAAAGLSLEGTYTAKAAAALLASLERDGPRPQLFWHTFSAAQPIELAGDVRIDQLPLAFRRYLQRESFR